MPFESSHENLQECTLTEFVVGVHLFPWTDWYSVLLSCSFLKGMAIWFQFNKTGDIAPILIYSFHFGVRNSFGQCQFEPYPLRAFPKEDWKWKKFCFCFFSDSSLKRVVFGRMRRHVDGLMNCFSQNIHLDFAINLRPYSISIRRPIVCFVKEFDRILFFKYALELTKDCQYQVSSNTFLVFSCLRGQAEERRGCRGDGVGD